MRIALDLKSLQEIQSPAYFFDGTTTTYDQLCLIKENLRELKYRNSPEVTEELNVLKNKLKINLNKEHGDVLKMMGTYKGDLGTAGCDINSMKANEKAYYQKCRMAIDEI